MDVRKFEYIVAIADEGTISRAADKMFISRPALNHFLLDLENELGTPLFKRINKRLEPTYAGSVYIKGAREVLAIKNQTYKLIDEVAGNRIGTISLGITHGIGNAMFANVFPKFHRLYPNYMIKLKEANVRDLESMVEDGIIDIAVVGNGSVPTHLHHITTISCEVALILPPNHPLGEEEAPAGKPHDTLDLRRLKDEAFILMNSDTNIRTIANKHFALAEYTPRILVECSMSILAYQLVKAGLGPSILMEYQVNPADGVHVFSLNPVERWYQSVAFRKGTIFTKAENDFISLILEFFNKSTPSQIFR